MGDVGGVPVGSRPGHSKRVTMKSTSVIGSLGGLLLLGFAEVAPAAISAIGTTDQLDRARKYQALVAVPGHDDVQEWTSSFDLGMSYASGNSETLLVTTSFTIDKEFGLNNEFFSNITYAYGTDEGATTTEEALATASWRHLFRETLYRGVRLDGRHDELADIKYRIGISALIGHYFVRDEMTQISLEGGLGYTWEEQGGVSESFFNLYLGERAEHWVTDYTRIFQSFAVFEPVSDFADFRLILELGLETFLSQNLSFKVFMQDKFENTPAPLREQNDIKVVSGISYKF